ncbi:hypothetical protein AQUCO_14800004v1 [Aquilegia coerulea]|uniref:GOST seven transmembrane domain-containing protein n=1 Tax=Aquilegia coerulea TaxID=218851 RepID=A0A2G5C278_AQUCA|nr:hypothetical protein AQUCO_14800004v1 [Aquilegia coerulea]
MYSKHLLLTLQLYFKANDVYNEQWQSACIVPAFYEVLSLPFFYGSCALWAPSQTSTRGSSSVEWVAITRVASSESVPSLDPIIRYFTLLQELKAVFRGNSIRIVGVHAGGFGDHTKCEVECVAMVESIDKELTRDEKRGHTLYIKKRQAAKVKHIERYASSQVNSERCEQPSE